MVNQNHLKMLYKGKDVWNNWRYENPSIKPNLREVNLSGADLSEINLREADFSEANLNRTCFIGSNLNRACFLGAILNRAQLNRADLREANLSGADLIGVDFSGANLGGANLSETNLMEANLSRVNLSGANLFEANIREANLFEATLTETNLTKANLIESNLREANLRGANLSEVNFTNANLAKADMSRTKIIGATLNGATLTDCKVFGISAWGLTGLEEAEQSNLVITPHDEPVITVDNLEVAQFIYLLLHSEKIRSVIDTITSKAVLILGRFTPERKAILDAIRVKLRETNYLPILFDFEKPKSRNLTETVSTLAHMARFVIADITDAKSIPQELERIVPRLSSVPVQPILLSSSKEYGMFEDFKDYHWVLKIHRYHDIDDLTSSLREKVITPAEDKAKELQKK